MKTKGHYVITSPEGGEEGQTLSCVHCGRIWKYERGSGRQRGFCMNCFGVTCGSKECQECVPLMKKIEQQESKDALMRSIQHGS